jgi:signal transduction histidine kinase
MIKKYTGVLITVGIGVGLSLVHILHAAGGGETFLSFVLGIIIPMISASGVAVGGFWLWQQDLKDRLALSVGLWCALGAAILALAGAFVIIYQQQYGVMMDERPFIIANGASGGALIGFVTGVYNIRQRQAQARADRLTQRLTVVNRVLRHDIRNSAAVIRGNANLLTNESADVMDKADTIKQRATYLVSLGDQARDIEQVLINQETKRESTDIVPIINECCTQVRDEYSSAEITTSLPSTLSVVTHQLISSALMNLLENAIEHNDKQTPRVIIDSTEVSHNGTEYVELRVTDNGPGIADSDIEVLNRGYETDLEHTDGLGLWLVNWIVADVNGKLEFESNEDEGTTVCVQLKRAGS